jgi:3-phenylpropionate/trans-cinnamate dioxygenase ferredoxin reductase subunit
VAHVLVLGAGLAGARMCAELRAAGFPGRVTLVGAEQEAPYDRPPLSKDPAAEVDLRQALGIDVWALAEEVRLGVRARGVAVRSGAIEVSLDGGLVPADAVVLATGAAPAIPTGWLGAGVHVLNTRAEARALWEAVGPGVRLDVVGGGWVGCEAAATAAARGALVRVHEAARQLLPGRVPAPVAARVEGWLAELGVEVRLGTPVSAVLPGEVPVVESGGARWGVDVVLAALGVRPDTRWLVDSGVDVAASGAVPVDPWGRTAVPGVVALGDAATRWSPRAGRHVPSGHWTEALNAPSLAAAPLVDWLGAERSGEAWRAAPADPAPDPVPYVFSDIAGRTLQVLGEEWWMGAGEVEHLVWRESQEGWSAFRLDPAGGLLGIASVGRPRDVAMARRAILGAAAGAPRVDRAALADPKAPAASVLPSDERRSGG